MSSAGDFNNDGCDDVLVGAYNYATNDKRTYLYLGGAVINNTIDLKIITSGDIVSNAGDINNDGFDDIILGNTSTNTAELFYGGTPLNNIADKIFNVGSDEKNEFISGAGDVNGDGISDLLIGFSEVYNANIFLGSNSFDTVSDVTVWSGDRTGNDFGASIAKSGDLNGDGYNDIVIGAPGYDSDKGRVYVYKGGVTIDNIYDMTFAGACQCDEFGNKVAFAGDVNNDGYDDLLVGAPDYNSGKGRVYLNYGSSAMNISNFLFFDGENDSDNFGSSFSSAGDLNKDGFDDIVVGAMGFNSQVGKAYIYFGGALMDNSADLSINGEAVGAIPGFGIVSSAGDVNGDSWDDIIISSSFYGNNFAGKSYLYYGGASMDAIADADFTRNITNDFFGFYLSAPGDINLDGYDDILIGNIGALQFLYLGSSSMDNSIDYSFGRGVCESPGDLTGDSVNDILQGDSYYGDNGRVVLYKTLFRPAINNLETSFLNYTEDGSEPISNTLILYDPPHINLIGGTVSISGNYHAGEDTLVFHNQNGIAGSFNIATGTLSLSGISSLGNYQDALRSICYVNTSQNPVVETRTISIVVSNSDIGGLSVTRDITITAVNDDPVISVNTGIILDEAASETITSAELQCTDPDQTTYFLYTITEAPANGELKKDGAALALNSTFTQDELNANKITYTHNGSETTIDSVKFGAADNQNATTPETEFNITINPINDAPVLAGTEATALAYNENAGALSVTTSITLTDVDDANIESAIVQITGNYQDDQDVLQYSGTTTITGQWNSGAGALTLTGSDTKTNYEAALRSVKYYNTSDDPVTSIENADERIKTRSINASPRTVSFTINDGDLNSNTVTRDIKLSATNDAPVVTTNTGAVVDEGTSVTLDGSMLQASDVDGNSLSLRYYVEQQPANGELNKDVFTQNEVNNGNVSYTHNGSETTSDGFVFKVVDCEGGSSSNYTFNITINPVNDSPAPPTDVVYSYDENGNIVITWYDNSGNEIGFEVWRQRNTTAKASIITEYELIATLPADTETFVDENIEEGESYSYQVTSFNDEGPSGVATGDNGGETNAPAPLSRPTNLQSADNGNGTITIEWEDNSSLETSYKIERTTNDTWNELYTAVENATTYTDTNVEEGITYHYRVKAINTVTESVYSNECYATCTITGVEEWISGTPVEFTLHQNYPNPFNPSTTIRYGLPEEAHVKVVVYNMLGQVVATLVDQYKSAGYHDISFYADGLNSGIYLYKIEAGSFTEIKKCIFMK